MAGVFVRHRCGVACDYYSSSARQELGGSKGEDHSRRKCDVLGPDSRGGARCNSGQRADTDTRRFRGDRRCLGDALPGVLARVRVRTRAEDERRARRAAARDADLCVTRSAGAGAKSARYFSRLSISACPRRSFLSHISPCEVNIPQKSAPPRSRLPSYIQTPGPDAVVEVRRVEAHHRRGPGLKDQRPEGDFRPFERRAERVL